LNGGGDPQVVLSLLLRGLLLSCILMSAFSWLMLVVLGHYGGFDLLLTTSLRTDFILARVLN
jgi:hypothetical protein